VSGFQSCAIPISLIVPFFFSDDDLIAKVSESYLRVLGLATPHSPVATKILRTAADLGLMDRQWIIFDDAIWQAMSSFERRAWSGMMHLGAVDNSCCTPMANKLAAIWHTLSWKTLIDNHVPEPVVTRMQQENHDLFQQSPWQGKGAFFYDAIMMALLAFKLQDKSVSAVDHKPGQNLSSILKDIRLTGVSGFLNYTKHPEARMNLNQLHAGAYVSVALLDGKRVLFTRQVIFPNGGSDPWAYDYKLPVDQPKSRVSHLVQYHASGDGQQVPAKMDWGSTIIKTLVGCVVVVLVCIALPSCHNTRGWARTVIHVRHPGGQSNPVSTSNHDEELADEVTE